MLGFGCVGPKEEMGAWTVVFGAEILGKLEGCECLEMAGWSAVIGVNWLWGASSARTKAAGSPLILVDYCTEPLSVVGDYLVSSLLQRLQINQGRCPLEPLAFL